jgi:hypothetical protein
MDSRLCRLTVLRRRRLAGIRPRIATTLLGRRGRRTVQSGRPSVRASRPNAMLETTTGRQTRARSSRRSLRRFPAFRRRPCPRPPRASPLPDPPLHPFRRHILPAPLLRPPSCSLRLVPSISVERTTAVLRAPLGCVVLAMGIAVRLTTTVGQAASRATAPARRAKSYGIEGVYTV